MSGSDYHYLIITQAYKPNLANLFNKERLLKIMLRTARALPFGRRKKAFREVSLSFARNWIKKKLVVLVKWNGLL